MDPDLLQLYLNTTFNQNQPQISEGPTFKYPYDFGAQFEAKTPVLSDSPDISPGILGGTRFLVDTNPEMFFPANRTAGLRSIDLSDLNNMGVANEEDAEQVDYVPGAKPKEGIARLFEVLGKIPTPFNLARRGIESLSRIPRSDFFKSKNLMDYLDMRRYGGAEARERARQKNLRETAAIQKQLDLRTAAGMYDVGGDRGRSVAAKEAATRSKDLQSMRGGVGR